MSTLLERMERQAIVLDPPTPTETVRRSRGRRPLQRHEIITDIDLSRDEQTIGGEARTWKQINEALAGAGDPTALLGMIAGCEREPPDAALAAVTGGTVNVALWSAMTYTPIDPVVKKPKHFDLFAEGTVTSTGAGQTLIINPNISNTGAVGTGLTASAAQTLGSTITGAVWQLEARITVRTVGTGTTATAQGAFKFGYSLLANGGPPTWTIWRSTANATFDSTVTNGLVIGVTPSAAGVSVTPQQIRWASWT
jgi:hypothetical protein